MVGPARTGVGGYGRQAASSAYPNCNDLARPGQAGPRRAQHAEPAGIRDGSRQFGRRRGPHASELDRYRAADEFDKSGGDHCLTSESRPQPASCPGRAIEHIGRNGGAV